MDVTPAHSSSKRTRAKIEPKKATAPKRVRNTLTTARKKPPSALEAGDANTDIGAMIATAAFYLAAERNFEPGHELDDWLEAERRIRAMHTA